MRTALEHISVDSFFAMEIEPYREDEYQEMTSVDQVIEPEEYDALYGLGLGDITDFLRLRKKTAVKDAWRRLGPKKKGGKHEVTGTNSSN